MYALGFMQGRLSPKVDNKIQAFPRQTWQQEFELAHAHQWSIMEWTIDQDGFDDNPIMTIAGRQAIQVLMQQYHIRIPSVTADFTMQAPFYKAHGQEAMRLLEQLRRFLNCSQEVGVKRVVVPLVDNGSLTSVGEEAALRKGLASLEDVLSKNNQEIIFESDFNPSSLATFIASLSKDLFGINYDSGNSASLGYNIAEEFNAYGQYIKNVHIKDRAYQGTTVALGEGDVDFISLFEQLVKVRYTGNLIFQTARANDDNHIGVLNEYRHFIERIILA
jgi:L-ribulose-5-phosphate 3-epimerase